MIRIKLVTKITAGQSPISTAVEPLNRGRAFLQGNAEFGLDKPYPVWECSDPPKTARQGDVLVSVRAPVGAVSVADQSYGIGRGLNSVRATKIEPRYLRWLLIDAAIYLNSIATGSTYAAITSSDLGSVAVPITTLDEQRQIAEYLDRETGKIDELIAKQEQLVATLTERRQAVIAQVVTRGLDSTAKLKDSGFSWLGEVPAHWVVTSLGRRIDVLTGFPFRSEEFSSDDAHTRLLRGVNVNPGTTAWHDVVFWERQPGDGLDQYSLEEGDIVLGLDRPFVSSGTRVAQIVGGDLPSLLLQRVARIRPTCGAFGPYLLLLLSGQIFHDYLSPIFTGVSVPHMSPEQLRKFVVAFPPEAEQQEIASFIAVETRQINRLITKAREMIALLRERRAALISAAVTGKIDVRGL